MPTPTSTELQKLLDEFAKQPGVTAESNLRTSSLCQLLRT